MKSGGFRSRIQRLPSMGTHCAVSTTLIYLQKLALTLPTSGVREVDIVHLRTESHGFCVSSYTNFIIRICIRGSISVLLNEVG
jgi:hypothetical protein